MLLIVVGPRARVLDQAVHLADPAALDGLGRGAQQPQVLVFDLLFPLEGWFADEPCLREDLDGHVHRLLKHPHIRCALEDGAAAAARKASK